MGCSQSAFRSCILGLGSETSVWAVYRSIAAFQESLCFSFPAKPAMWPWAKVSLLRAEWAFQTLGGPHSNTHVYQEEQIIMRTWGRWMELWASFSPQLHKFLDHFLSNYMGVRSDHWFSSLLFDQGYFFCCLTIPCWSYLQCYPSTGWFCTTLPAQSPLL